jgi:uncharacterized membrane protein YphA (DoxX/SURF4 family)
MLVYGGWDAFLNPTSKVKAAEPVAGPLADRIPGPSTDVEKLVRLNGAVMVAGGALLAIGRFRRIAALALLASLAPTTLAGHRFWEESDDSARKQQQIQFLKNMGLAGGLILAALDTEGRPSLGWRAKRAARRASGALHTASGAADRVGELWTDLTDRLPAG